MYKHCPDAYTMDVGVTVDRESYLIELHQFCASRVYITLIDIEYLINTYSEGYKWYLSDNNKPIRPFVVMK